MKKEQKYFERSLTYSWEEDEKRFFDLLRDGWKVIIAIPVQNGRSCHTYTSSIHYVLEREVEIDESKRNWTKGIEIIGNDPRNKKRWLAIIETLL